MTTKYQNVFLAENYDESLQQLVENDIDLVILDYHIPGVKDFEILDMIMKRFPATKVIIISEYSSSIDTVVRAVKKGASDYIAKPIDARLFLHKIENILKSAPAKRRRLSSSNQTQFNFRYDNFIGNSKIIQEIFKLLQKVVDFDTTILIQGESGTGKEEIAKAIHYNSNRAHKMFLPIDLGAISFHLIESELFG